MRCGATVNNVRCPKQSEVIHCICGVQCPNFLFLVNLGRLDLDVQITSISSISMPKTLNNLCSKLVEFSKIMLGHM